MDKQVILQSYMKARSQEFYKKFWANIADQGGLTVTKLDGTKIQVKYEDIWVNDLGEMCGHCLCGHAIRYEYHIGEVAPIGSSCIKVMTGLDGQDLRTILQGGEIARKERDDLELALESYQTLEDQINDPKYEYLKEPLGWFAYSKLIDTNMELANFIGNHIPCH